VESFAALKRRSSTVALRIGIVPEIEGYGEGRGYYTLKMVS